MSESSAPRPSVGRWVLFAPAGIAAFLLVMLVIVLVRDFAGTPHPIRGDQLVDLFTNALAVCVGSLVAILVAPAHRTKVAVLWVALIFLTACYGNFVNSAVIVPPTIAYRNITVITFGAILGGVVAKAWLRRRAP